VIDDILTRAFERETAEKAIGDTKAAAIAASIAFPAFGILDFFVYPSLFLIFLIIRAAVVAICLAAYGLMFTKLGKRYPRDIGLLGYLA
jgi:heme O synthase-like polyprenyltransferase